MVDAVTLLGHPVVEHPGREFRIELPPTAFARAVELGFVTPTVEGRGRMYVPDLFSEVVVYRSEPVP